MAHEDEASMLWTKAFAQRDRVNGYQLSDVLAARFKDITPNIIRDVTDNVIDGECRGTVTKQEFTDFVARFGPFDSAIQRCHANIFDSDGIVYPWFYPRMDRVNGDAKASAMPASYLVRYSGQHRDKLVLTYSQPEGTGLKCHSVLISNVDGRWKLEGHDALFSKLTELFRSLGNLLRHPVESDLYTSMKKQRQPKVATAGSNSQSAYSSINQVQSPYTRAPDDAAASASPSPYVRPSTDMQGPGKK